MADELELTLIKNAEDFLVEAVKYAKAASSRDWKYAVLHLWTALELLLKALLEEEHWSLLFEDVHKASRKKLSEGGFHTVRFDTALDRIRGIAEVELEEKDLRYLKQLRELRNRAIHFTLKLNVEQAKSLVARGISVFLTLEQQHLHETPDKSLEYEINQTLRDFHKYVDERLRTLEPELKSSDQPHRWFRMCRECTQETLVLGDEGVVCLFCGNELDFVDLAEHSEGSLGPCPECDDGILAFVLLNNDEGRVICPKCGFETEENFNEECGRCGKEFWNKDGDPMCRECWSELLKKD
jgi:primosomal protein N'